MASVIDAILRLKDEFTPTLQKVTSQLNEHEKAQKRLSNQYVKTGNTISSFGTKVALISAPLEAAAMAGLKLHSDFAAGMEKVSTLVDKTTVSIQKLSDGVRKVSDETGVSVTDLAESEYQAISAGVDAANVTQFLDTVTKASIAGYTDSTTAINGVTTVLNSYGMAASEASKVTDEMLITQNLGKTSFGELAQGIGNVTPLAKTLGVTTDELFASLASLTKNGIQTSEAITGLKAAFSNIVKPSSEASKIAAQIGMDFSTAHLKSVGWAKFLDEIKEKTGGNIDTMGKLFGSVKGLNGILSLTGQGSKDFADALQAIGDQAGITDRVFDDIVKNDPTKAMQIAMNELKNAGMDLGGSLAPLLKSSSKAIKELATVLREMTPEERNFIMTIGQSIIVFGIATTGIGKLVTGYGNLRKTVVDVYRKINKAGSISGAISKELPAFEIISKHFKSTAGEANIFKRALTSLGTSINTAFVAMLHPFETFRTAYTKGLEAVGTSLASFGSRVIRIPSLIGSAIVRSLNFMAQIPSVLSSAFSRVTTIIRNPIASFRTLFSVIRGGFTAIRILMASNPIGLALLAISVAIMFVIKNFNTFKQTATTVFNHVRGTVQSCVNALAPVFTRLWTAVHNAMNKIAAALGFGSSTTQQTSATMKTVINTLGSVFSFVFDLIAGVVTTAVGVIANVLGTAINVFGDVITFINDVFVGDWQGAWEQVKKIFVDIIDGIKQTFSDAMDTISRMIDRIIGRSHDAENAANEAKEVDSGSGESSGDGSGSWTGASWFPGGTTWLHEQGPELVYLPTGARVVPHSDSLKEEYQRGLDAGTQMLRPVSMQAAPATVEQRTGDIKITIPKLADQIVVREKQDIDNIANALVFKLKQYAMNRMEGAIV